MSEPFIFLHLMASGATAARENGLIVLHPTGAPEIAISFTAGEAASVAHAMLALIAEAGVAPATIRQRVLEVSGYEPKPLHVLGEDGVGLLLTNFEVRQGGLVAIPQPRGATEDEALLALWAIVEALGPDDAVVIGASGLYGPRRELRWQDGQWIDVTPEGAAE